MRKITSIQSSVCQPICFMERAFRRPFWCLKKNRKTKDVLFIDASREFEKGKNQNILNSENINKIIRTFKERKDVDKYAHVASIEEIKENEYNLNIPRYVDTFEEEEPIDLNVVIKQLEEDNK